MNKKTSSTKTNPVKNIEHFLKKESFETYEKSFFDNHINPSFKSNRKDGFISYLKDSYAGNELPSVKLYFKDKLTKDLNFYVNQSIALAKERKDEIENLEQHANIYINQQLRKLASLKKSIDYFESYQSIIFRAIDKLEVNLLNLLEEKQKVTPSIKVKSYGKTYFDLKKDIRPRHLKKLYELSIDIDIIDEDVVSEDDFIKVFTLTKLPSENYKIVFNKDNRTVVYYINIIAYFFNNLRPRTIQNSQSFFNKRGKMLNENDINKVNNDLKNSDVSKYNYLKLEIEKILLK